MSLWRVLGLAMVLTFGGCLGSTVPLPPPGASFSLVEECSPASACPEGSVVFTLSGADAQPGATVFVVDHARCIGTTCLTWNAQADASRAWTMRCGPQQLEPGMFTAARHGDELEIYQIDWRTNEVSNSHLLNVP